MDAWLGQSLTPKAPEFFYKNGKKPQIASYIDSDGSTFVMRINSIGGKKFTKTTLKKIENETKQERKSDDIREAMRLRLEQRKLEKQQK